MVQKGTSPTNEAKTSKSKSPFGMNHGSGVRQKVGKVRAGTVGINPLSKKKLKEPPKKLA